MFASLRLATFALALGLGAATFAEESHHPPAGAAPAQMAQTQPPQQAQPGGPMQPGMGPMGPGQGMGMMGQGMTMGPGMMGQGGMMGGGMPGMMPMIGMMQGDRHIEGRLAFVKAELKITAAQEKAWNDFANALRQASAKAHEAGGMRPMSGAPGASTPPQLVEQYEKHLAARLEAVRIVKPTLEPLYTSLSDEQKQTFTQVHMIFHGLI